MASLKPALQKIGRAYLHLKVCEAECIRYFEQNPGEVVGDCDSDPNGRVVLNFKTRVPVPDDIPMIIGDALQNLRSTLDYLVWELVLAANKQPTKNHMFPICDTPDLFKQQLGRDRLDGIFPEAIAEIERLQPYHYGIKKELAPIRVLDDFTNINKHRRILLTTLAAHSSHTEFISSASGHIVQDTLSPRYDGAEIAVGPIPSADGEQMEVKGKAIVFLTFNEGAAKGIEVSICLNQLWHFVDKIVVPKFARFFV